MEGYLFDRDDAKAAFRRAARAAHEAGREVSLSLSDSFCVDRHREDFRAIVADEVVAGPATPPPSTLICSALR